jgi:hypothetical protein
MAQTLARGFGSRESRPDEIRILRLQPTAAPPALVEAAGSLRHDPLQAKLAGFGVYYRAIFDERFAEQDCVAASLSDETHERFPPPLQPALPQIVAAKTQKVEGDE